MRSQILYSMLSSIRDLNGEPFSEDSMFYRFFKFLGFWSCDDVLPKGWIRVSEDTVVEKSSCHEVTIRSPELVQLLNKHFYKKKNEYKGTRFYRCKISKYLFMTLIIVER